MTNYYVEEDGVYTDSLYSQCTRCKTRHYRSDGTTVDTRCTKCGGSTEGWFTERVLVTVDLPAPSD